MERSPLRRRVCIDVAALGRLLRDPRRGRFTVQEFLNKTHDGILPELDQALGTAGPGDLF